MEGLEDDYTILKSFIAITKGGLNVEKLRKEYREETGSNINYSKYGFKSFLSMLEACPDIKVYNTPDGLKCEAYDKKMSHVTSLVNRTRTAKKGSRKKNFYRPRPSFCTTQRSFYSPQRDSKFKFGGSTSMHQQGTVKSIHYGNSPRNFKANYQMQNGQRNFSQHQAAFSSNHPLPSEKQSTKFSQSSNSQAVHHVPKSMINHDPKPNGHKMVKEVASRIYSSKPKSTQINASSDSDWSSDSDTNVEPARAVAPPVKAHHPQQSVQVNTVSSSKRPRQLPYISCKSSHVRNSCSFGARDIRYLSDTKKNQVGEENSKMTQMRPVQQQPAASSPHQPSTVSRCHQPSTSSSHHPLSTASSHQKLPSVPPQSSSRVVLGLQSSKVKSSIQAAQPNTSDQAGKKLPIHPSDSDEEIEVSGSPIKRVSSTIVRNGLPTIVVKVPNRYMGPSEIVEKNVLSTCEPMYGGFQFIGDFFITRIAEVCLDSQIQKEGDISYCGLCRDNMTIAECEESIVRQGTSGKVVLMIGMTDIMQGASVEDLKRDTLSLLQRLKYNTILLLTLPVPPSFIQIHNERKLAVLELYNKWLLNLNLPRLIDVDRHLYSDPPFYLRLPYAKVETFSEGGAWIVMDEIISALR